MAVPGPIFHPNYETDSCMMMKAPYKKKTEEQNGTYHAGYAYTATGGEQRHKTGITREKRWILLAIIIFMIFMAVSNLMLSAAIIYVLRFDFEGMPAIEMVSPSILTRFVQDVELVGVAPYSGVIDGLPDEYLLLTGTESEVKLEVEDICTHTPPSATGKDTISVSAQADAIRMVADEGFHVISPEGQPVFTTDHQILDMPWVQNVSHLELTELITSKIYSPKSSSLHLESEGEATIQGMLGLTVHGNQVVIVAKEGVDFRSRGTGVKLSAPQGVYFEKVKHFRRSSGKKARRQNPTFGGNSLCVCGNNGRVFMVPDKGRGLGCANANEHINPCE
ncbi:uncharacterized protein LOC135493631 [Lineus longissimus]|uniref:uncharacterized protein LOC135493631 n=1 Tax=Lineus longissimus TaxID=88925 RepID=UPI002B4D6B8D